MKWRCVLFGHRYRWHLPDGRRLFALNPREVGILLESPLLPGGLRCSRCHQPPTKARIYVGH